MKTRDLPMFKVDKSLAFLAIDVITEVEML